MKFTGYPVDSVFAMKQLPKEFGTDHFGKTAVPQLMEGRTGAVVK